jgi:radical SAM protein with 4Fe4S-binding SPASM domain
MNWSKFQDIKQIMRTLTFRRLVNLIQLSLSFRLTKWKLSQTHHGQPFALSIEPTTACNLSCPACPSGLKSFSRPTGKIDLAFHETIIASLKKSVFYINYYFQGEPFLHPQFLTLIKTAKAANIYTATSTNGHFISDKNALAIVDSGLDRLIISIDGLTQETYASYRVDGELKKVISATKSLIEAKKQRGSATPYLIFQLLVLKTNEDQIDALNDLAKTLGVNEVRFKTAQFYAYENGNELMPSNEKYSRYIKKRDGSYRVKYYGGNHCWRMWSSSVITWDGKVVPCCFDKDAQHALGELKTEGFDAIWNGATYQQFRTAVLTNRNDIDICTNCSEGAKVWVE